MDYLLRELLKGMEGKTDPKKPWLEFFKLAHPNFEKIDLNKISPSNFYRTFGTANPSMYCNPFYSHMIKEGLSPFDFKYAYDLDYNAYCPIFTFLPRIGMSQTSLPSLGFTVFIGGEYDDYYDPDFLIYNDVIVRYDDGTIKHFGYPEDVFPCTDFHSATYYPADNCIYIIGGIGYNSPKDGVKKDTPVFKLELRTFEISKVDFLGENPGWIHHHEAKLKGNKIWVFLNGKRTKGFYLDLETRTWGKKISKK
jgi:hypothetical protein